MAGIDGGSALRVEVVPPLSRATSWIEVVTTGRSAEARARLLAVLPRLTGPFELRS